MTPAARLSAAIELIDTVDAQRIPAAKLLKEWGTAHRYAGSGDRAAISGLIWDVLRRRASSAWIMDNDTPRARVLGMLKVERGMDVDAIVADRPAHRTRRRCPQSRHSFRGRFYQRRDRGAGRGLAVGGLAVGGKTRRAGHRPLRRRRRQDAGAGGDDAGQGPADRDRPRQAAVGADLRAAVPRWR